MTAKVTKAAGMPTTIGRLMERAAARFGDREALVYPQHQLRYSYRELDELTRLIAAGLMHVGVAKGEHVALWAPNIPQWVPLQIGVARAGAVLIPVNTGYRFVEMDFLLKQSDATTLIFDDGHGRNFYEILNQLLPELRVHSPGGLCSDRFPFLRRVVSIGGARMPGVYTLAELMEMGRGVPREAQLERERSVGEEDIATVQYTSGTGGQPKGVMLSHRNIVLDALGVAGRMGLTHEDRVCIPVPFFHCFGNIMGSLASIGCGAAMVPVEEYSPEAVLEIVEAERCTALYGVPSMFYEELDVLARQPRDLSNLRTGIMAGAPCPRRLVEEVVFTMGIKGLTIAYGLTETSPVITQTDIHDPLEKRLDSVGRVLEGVEIKVVDPQNGEILPPGQQGELCVRGFNVMQGYYKMPEATAAAFDPSGWLYTGDLGVIDDQGFFHVTGRLRDMIICRGEHIFPREIEEFLGRHPQILAVEVVGVPHPLYGEEVVAFVRLRPGQHLSSQDIRAFCQGKIADFKIPAQIYILPMFPTTVTGKVLKYKLREALVKGLI